MTLQSVTVNLPDVMYKRFQHVAAALNRPMEEIVFQSIQGNLPPDPGDLPSELRHELTDMQSMADQELWVIAKAGVDSAKWERHQELLDKKQVTVLTPTEERELTRLRQTVDQIVMCRSYAMALLKWRGHSLTPLLTPIN
ncbi:MAG: hypothetical protein R3C14_23840 [Caldilineaceae bacterium]